MLFLVAARAAWIPSPGPTPTSPSTTACGSGWGHPGAQPDAGVRPHPGHGPQALFTARASFFTILGRPYLTNARAKGLTAGRIRTAYILRNAATPIVARFFLSVGARWGHHSGGERLRLPRPGHRPAGGGAVPGLSHAPGVFLLSAVLVLLSLAAADVVNRLLDGEEEGP
ncbi:ABC transporter permease subunit [Flavonifractor plautii]|nr:ABC transporter permease subunit [Flavonifractor plautii]